MNPSQSHLQLNPDHVVYQVKLLTKIIATGLVFTAINIGLFFDQIILPKFLLSIFKVQPLVNGQNSSALTASFQNLLLTVFLGSKIIFLIVAGTISDHIKTPVGNRIPIILAGILMMILGYTLGSFLINGVSFRFLFPLLYALIGAGSAFATAPGYALVVDMFRKHERGWAGMGIALFSAVGTLIGILLEDLRIFSFKDFFLIVPVILFLLAVLIFVLLPKIENKVRPPYSFTHDLKYTPAYLFNLEKYHGLGENGTSYGNDIFIKLLFIQVFMGASVYLIAIDVPLFLIVLNGSEFGFGLEPGFALIVIGAFGIIFAGPIGYIIRYIGKTQTAIGGSFVFGLSNFLLAQPFMWNYDGFLIILMLIGSSSVIVSIMTVALPADKVPETNAGQFMGIFTVASMILLPVFTFLTAVLFSLVRDKYLGFQILFYSMGLIQLFVITLLYSLDKKEKLVLQKALTHPDLQQPNAKTTAE